MHRESVSIWIIFLRFRTVIQSVLKRHNGLILDRSAILRGT